MREVSGLHTDNRDMRSLTWSHFITLIGFLAALIGCIVGGYIHIDSKFDAKMDKVEMKFEAKFDSLNQKIDLLLDNKR